METFGTCFSYERRTYLPRAKRIRSLTAYENVSQKPGSKGPMAFRECQSTTLLGWSYFWRQVTKLQKALYPNYSNNKIRVLQRWMSSICCMYLGQLQGCKKYWFSRCSFISQTTSWSRLRISPEMFDRLIQFYDVFEEFFPYVFVFGKRIRDPPETSITSHMRWHTNKSSVSGYGLYIINILISVLTNILINRNMLQH